MSPEHPAPAVQRVRLNYAIIYVSDMKRSVAFYRDGLGLSLKFETPEWTEFETGEATLALHAGGPAASEAGGSKQISSGSCRPGLSVSDIDAFHRLMLERKVTCTHPPKDVFGARIAQYLDPDGLMISVSEDRARG